MGAPFPSPAGAADRRTGRRRTYTYNVKQTEAGAAFSVEFSPQRQFEWEVEHLAITVPNWRTGQLRATIYVNEAFYAASSHGEQDTAAGTPLPLRSNDKMRVTWEPQVFTVTVPPVDTGQAEVVGIASITVLERSAV